MLIDSDLVSSGYAVFNFSHRGMLMGSRGFDRYSPVPLLVQGIETPESYVYRSIVIDCLLAVKILSKLGNIDAGRMATVGTSQGGALSIATASLNPGVKAVAADLPWLADFSILAGAGSDGPNNELKEYLRRSPKKAGNVARTLGYFDAASFAEFLTCPAFLSLGQDDPVAPAAAVRNLHSRIPVEKLLLEIPRMGHERSTLFRFLARQWFDFFV